MQKRFGVYAILFLSLLVLALNAVSVNAVYLDPCDSVYDCDDGESCYLYGDGRVPAGYCEYVSVGGDSADAGVDGDNVDVEPISVGGSMGYWKNFLNLEGRWRLWTAGYDNLKASDMTLLGETLKYLVLIMIIIAVYGAFAALEFPSSSALRFLMSVVVGLLGTFMITTKELLTALVSYGALSTTIILAVPVIVLLGLTLMAAYKANSIGLYASKILWAAYSIFLFIKGAILLSLTKIYYVVPSATSASGYVAARINASNKDLPSMLLPFLPKFRSPSGVMNVDLREVGRMMGNADITTAWVLVISAVVLFFFMVIKSKWIYMWMSKEAKEAAIEAKKTQSQLATAKEKIDADAMRQAGKSV